MVDFTVRRDGITEDAVYDVDPLSDTANPFGDYAVVKIDDRGGEKFGKYSRGTALEVTINDDGQTFDRFDGYVVEARETEQSGADALVVEAYTFDQFLRRNTVSNNQTGNTIAEALESIVKNDTPVSYVASNIEVSDPQELTRSYRGEPVEVVLRDLAFKSGNEAFGVNDSREFFFRPRETKHIDRGIDNTQWFNYDIPELGKDAINEVEVFFNDGNESVVIDAPTDKLELQDGLSLPEPGTQREELNRPLVTDIQDAEDIGRQYLQFRNATLSGTVTTFGLYDAEPGDTINITIESRGIDTEFRIAAVEYRWGRDETILTVVERRGDQDKILSRISESVKRQEMETADRDAASNRVTTTNAAAIVDVTVDADGNTPDAVRFVNDGRNAIRDGWSGDFTPTIGIISLGTDPSGLSRSNSSLKAKGTEFGFLNQSFGTTTSVTYSKNIQLGNVSEIGLNSIDGERLYCRAVFDTPIDIDGTVSITLSVSNDDSVNRGTMTNDGLTAVRDTLADNNPNLPAEYGYGTDGSAVSVSDTALANEIKEVPLDTIGVQSANIGDDFESLTTIGSTDPFVVESNKIRLAQTTYIAEAEDTIGGEPAEFKDKYSNGAAAAIKEPTSPTVSFDFTLDHDVPDGNAYVLVRAAGEGSGVATTVVLDFDTVERTYFGEDPIQWAKLSIDGSVSAGEHTIEIIHDSGTAPSGSDGVQIDIVGFIDDRFYDVSTFDNSLDPSAGGYLQDPDLYPSGERLVFDKAITRRNIGSGNFESTWTDDNVTGAQAVELSPDGSTFTTFSNTQSSTYSFGSETQEITPAFVFDNYGTRTGATPLSGFKSQAIESWTLFADILTPTPDGIGQTNARGIVPPNTISKAFSDQISNETVTPYSGKTTGDVDATITSTVSGGQNTTVAVDVFLNGSRIATDSDGVSPSSGTATAEASVSLTETTFDKVEFLHNGDESAVYELFIENIEIKEAGLKSGSTLLTRHELAEFVLETDQRLASSETTRFKGTE